MNYNKTHFVIKLLYYLYLHNNDDGRIDVQRNTIKIIKA